MSLHLAIIARVAKDMVEVEGFHNMYDSRLKLQLLYQVMASHFPDEKQPSPDPSHLSAAVSIIRRHKLLSEAKQTDDLKAAVDAWNERVLSYVSSKMPDKCWAGICMLGVTCQECNRQRFLDSYSTWFQKLLVHLKPPTDSAFLRVAACASLSDLLTRLGSFSSVKKEGTSLAGKLVQPVLQLLGQDDSEDVSNDAADIFCVILKCFPSSLQQQYDNAESVLVSKILYGKCSIQVCQKFARCLAFLPRARSDGDSWYSMMQKVLLAINEHLNDAFQGFEDVNKASEAVVPLLPPGKDPPPPLGGEHVAKEAVQKTRNRFFQLLVPRVSSLMHCCCVMLTNPYPVQVTIPLGPLLALISRTLNVNGSPYQQPIGFSNQKHTLLCTELPALHSCALDLLAAVIKGVRSQLLPRAANIVRLLTEYFRRCVSPALRIKLYSSARALLFSMGVGMASYLAPAVIYNAIADLKGSNCGAILNSTNITGQPKSCTTGGGGLVQLSTPRKRKHISGLSGGYPASSGLERELATNDDVVSIPVQISALKALEALLTVGGALRSDRWRAEVDLVLITVATNASTNLTILRFCDEENVSCFEDATSFTTADFQLAAYKALLASLLSPCCHQPPYLSQGLALFRKGRQESGTELAEFCAHALLALEPLIHPRSLPYVGTPAMARTMAIGRGIQGNLASHIQKSNMFFPNPDGGPSAPGASGNMPFGSSIRTFQHGLQLGEDDLCQDDEIYLGWLGNGEDSNADQHHLYDNTEMPIESLVETLTENGGLQCPALDEMTNMASLQSPVNDEIQSIPIVSLNSPFSCSNIGTLPVGPVETDRTDPMDICEARQLRVDGTQDTKVVASVKENIGSTELLSSQPASASIENCACNPTATEIRSNSRETVLSEAATIHREACVTEGVETTVNIQNSKQESATRQRADDQCLEKLSAPFPLKPLPVSSTAESDSDAIPDIVDGDPDTE